MAEVQGVPLMNKRKQPFLGREAPWRALNLLFTLQSGHSAHTAEGSAQAKVPLPELAPGAENTTI